MLPKVRLSQWPCVDSADFADRFWVVGPALAEDIQGPPSSPVQSGGFRCNFRPGTTTF